MSQQNQVFFVGVDVGTGSARAALVSPNGAILKSAVVPIQTWNPLPDYYEQSSDDIWTSCITCIKKVTEGIDPETIKGLGFDATCSLVAIDKKGQPISLSPTGKKNQNIILWMDHRAAKEADLINSLNNPVLQYVGGKISPEMETPKLLWLKNNLRTSYDNTHLFLDLPDFLTWKATGSESRSLCSLVCKWTYDPRTGWNNSYFTDIGLEDLLIDNSRKIGSQVLPPGSPIDRGLSLQSSRDLQGALKPGTPVGTSIIDAHAGGLGLIGCRVPQVDPDFRTRLGLICGTSTCHMAVSADPIFTPGIWGPYFSAMVPGMWLNEGGQSATGKLIDHVIESHPAAGRIRETIGEERHVQSYLSDLLVRMTEESGLKSVAFLGEDLHVWPDFHGNRSPIADPSLKGMISGLSLSDDEESLAKLYLATVQALGYGTRHILETLAKSGHESIESILICGGLSKNRLFTQTQADIVNLPVVHPNEVESVLLGAAILGACAANYFEDIQVTIRTMGGEGKIVRPDSDPRVLAFHDRKYKVFLKMYRDQTEYRDIMNGL